MKKYIKMKENNTIERVRVTKNGIQRVNDTKKYIQILKKYRCIINIE